jgi:hypothetical protein
MPSKKWLTWQKKGAERSSLHERSLSTPNADQPVQTLQNASQTSAAISTAVQQPAPTLQSSPSSSDRIDKHGLFLLNTHTPQSDGVQVEESFSLDIIALHGITGDAYDTWTHENGKFWLQDFLPNELPGARVFSFGYPAEVFCSLGTGGLDSFARSLLEDLKRERRRKEVSAQFTSYL